MKRLLIIGFVVFFVSISSFAQKGATPEQKALKKVERLDGTLSLSVEQKEKLTALFMKEIDKKSQKEEIKSILTQEQYEKYEAELKTKKNDSKKSDKADKKGGKKGS